MKDIFSAEAAAKIGKKEGRLQALESAYALQIPTDGLEEWRYSPVGDIQLEKFSPSVDAPAAGSVYLPERLVSEYSAKVVIVNGWVLEVDIDPTAAASGLEVTAAADGVQASEVRGATFFDFLHDAFNPEVLRISIPDGVRVEKPVVLNLWHRGENKASFPSIEVSVGQNASGRVVESQRSDEGAGVSFSRVSLDLAEDAQLQYATVQNQGVAHQQLARQIVTVGSRSHVSNAVAQFGGLYSRVRSDCSLAGRGASNAVAAVYYGTASQVHDFRIFQHHEAKDTKSDLTFKGVLDDTAGSIYTGMVRIEPGGAGSRAYQTNKNVKLSDEAWAWSVPNLEIENNDVQCSHASTVSPVDEEQQFYLQSRGVSPDQADQLVVKGFYKDVLQKMSMPEILSEVESLVDQKLDLKSDVAAVAS